MKRQPAVALLLIGLTGVIVAVLIICSYKQRLQADVVITNADIGIPGVSKMYEARITNRGLLPVRVTSCDYLDDTLSPGTMVAYAVQRWNQRLNQWEKIVEVGQSTFCKPYPLGIVKANVTSKVLWRGQSLTTGEEATAARTGFNLGDRGRFVVFTKSPGDYSSVAVTGEFVIDEHPQTDVPLRVRH